MSRNKHAKNWLHVVLPSVLIVVWLVFAGLGAPYFKKIGGLSSTDLSSFLPKSAESTKVNDELKKFYDHNSLPVVVVFSKDGQKLSDNDMAKIVSVNNDLEKIDGVMADISPSIQSDDKKAALTIVPLTHDGDFGDMFGAIKQKLSAANLPVSYKLTGPAALGHDLQTAFSGLDSTLLFVAVAVVFIILLIVYRSPFLPFIVLATSMVALSITVFVVYILANANIVQLNGQVQGILFILVIGATTDYSLLYTARYREELAFHKRSWNATLAALKSAYEPIIAAGATVSAGLLCLLISDLQSNKALGPVGALGIVFSVAAALTLLPALLLAFGRNVFWPKRPVYSTKVGRDSYRKNHPAWAKVGILVRRHPRRVWAACLVVLLLAISGVFQLRANGVPETDVVLGKSESRDGQKILDEHFPGGLGSPAYIVARRDRQDEVVKVLDADRGVSSVSVTAIGNDSGVMPVGKSEAKIKDTIKKQVAANRDKQLAAIRARITQQMAGYPQQFVDAAYTKASAQVPSVDVLVAKLYPFSTAKVKAVDGKVLLQATLTDSSSSLASRDTVARLRTSVKKADSAALVGGTSAAQYDTVQAAIRDLLTVAPVILVAITIILMLLLRAVVAPLLLLFTTVMSFGATMGVSAYMFNDVWRFSGADPSILIYAFVFLVALGIDYNIFLMTRVREETQISGVGEGTMKGLIVTGGVITSAGIVLASTFASLIVIPILFLAQIAFIVTFGVLIDTIVVRSLLVPSLTLQIGRHIWWPSRLFKSKK